MLNKLLLAGILSAVCALPALAQPSPPSSDSGSSSTPSSNSDSQPSSPDGSGSMTIRQHLKQDLMKSGFTDVHVMPTSFFVRAKDKNGHRVMMMIGPDSVTTITNPGTKMSKSKSSGDKSSSSDSSPNQ